MNDPLLNQYLASNDVPCPGCGYNLRGVVNATCPECFRPLKLQVAASDPLARVQWLGWTAVVLMIVSNAHAVWQWWQMIAGGVFAGRPGLSGVAAWASMGVHALLAIAGGLWLGFVLSRPWPSPRPALGSPFVAATVQLLVLTINSLLATLLRAF